MARVPWQTMPSAGSTGLSRARRPGARALTRRGFRGALTAIVAAALLGGSLPSIAGAATNTSFPDLPPGFAKVQLAAGLKNPIVMAFAPNGDIYIGQQNGTIQIYRNGAVLATPLGTVPNVYNTQECGLLGIALDPNYATNGFMYISYVANVTNSSGTVQHFTRLSRFTVVAGALSVASEQVYYQGNQNQNLHHPGNTVKVGPDGKLWWSVGDNVPSISNAQTLTNIYGKMLRFNLDGTIPSDNPFLNVPNAVPAIYAWGLRNPFRFTFLPDGRAMTEDTGSSYWEEMDTIQRGGNYGWDFYEGNCFSCGYINPAYAYGHVPTDGAASATAAYSGTTFPGTYAHTVFVGDYQSAVIHAVAFDPTYTTEVSDTIFDSSVGTIADLEEGPDGNLYYVGIFEGSFWKIYPTGPFPPNPVASASPNTGLGPLTVQLSSAGTTDPYGSSLSYSWDFGDGSAASTSPNPSHTYASNGTYTATLTVSNGTSSAQATTTVVVGNTPPAASMTSPSSGSTYNAGDTVSFSGAGTDAADGTLPASDFSWQVDFISNGVVQPFYLNEVPGPFYTASGVASGTFQIPTDPTQVPGSFYRITMTATDSLGLKTVVTRDIHPNTTSWTANSSVAGGLFYVDGTLQAGSFTTFDVVGVKHVLIGIPAQTIGATRYRLNGWSDGSGQIDTVTSTATPATFTVNEDAVTAGSVPSGWTSADVGSPLMAGTADYSSATNTFYMDGAGADVYSPNDQFHYIYRSITGDGTIVGRLRYQTNSSPWAKAGLMFKASATGGATFVDALATGDVSASTPYTNGVDCTVDGCAAPLPLPPATGYGVRMQYTNTSGTASGITPASQLAGYASPNKWLKLQRAANTFTSWESNDGVTWSKIGQVTVTMPSTVTVGLFDTSHNIGQYSSVAFDNVAVTTPSGPPPNDFSIAASPSSVNVTAGASASTTISTALTSGTAETVSFSASGLPSGVTAAFSPTSVAAGGSSALTFTAASTATPGTYSVTVTGAATSATHSTAVSLTVLPPAGALPSPWLDTDVGSPTPAGSASYSNGVFTVNGSGADIWGTSDQFNYAYQNTSGSGNGTIIARVTSQSATGSSNSKAGIMWKASTTSGSPYIFVSVGPTGIVKVQYNFNGSIQAATTYAFPNVWMKLTRSGTTFTASVSSDGATWTTVLTKTLTNIPAAATVGLVECSHKTGTVGTATFDNVSFTAAP